ncbi:nucleotidyltransferase family protein [Sphingomonas sp. RS2018]
MDRCRLHPDAVWDDLHSYGARPLFGDVDVVFYDNTVTSEERDRVIEDRLRARLPHLAWSVKNQARMHRRNGDAPCIGVVDAMRHWPETATAVAARLSPTRRGTVEIAAPFGTTDLTALRLRPTPAFAGSKLPIFDERVADKRWTERYPLLTVVRTTVRSLADPSAAR